MTLTVNLGMRSYPVVIQRGILSRAADWFDLDRKVLVVTDSGVPRIYAETVAKQCAQSVIVTFPAGEESKNISTWLSLLDALTEHEFTRTDCVVAVGGGVVGDMSGFAAAAYLRGIDFYNVPTTLLAQIDSSVGGKVAVDYKGYKNIVGAFYQPKGVLIDPDVLDTLDSRQRSAGMAEAVKMAMIRDAELFELLERGEGDEKIEEVIYRSVQAKARVVEQDETEGGLRQILNFGHTLGHGIETASGYTLLHGECVALGMIPMTASGLRERLTTVLKAMDLPTKYDGDAEQIMSAMAHDKKRAGDLITVIRCPALGECILQPIEFEEFLEEIREVLR
ncbi:MAG: 3-dehydroquinate synthase [Clostridia bacterium]|nr:3-dehydroquinate synthase [Clostridia bacterium]